MTEWQRVLRFMQRRIGPRDDAMRVDRWLRQQFPNAPQSFLQKQLRQRKIRIVSNASDTSTSVPAKPHAMLHSGAIIAIDAVVFDSALASAMENKDPLSQDMELSTTAQGFAQELVNRVVYHDDNYLVLNKPHGLAVQDGTALDHSLVSYLPSLSKAFPGSNDDKVPRLVHRLDKETSGVLVLARHRLAAARFSQILRDGGVHKTYDAVVKPRNRTYAEQIPANGEITLAIDGKPAKTLFRRLQRGTERTDDGLWLEMQPITGRKHQLRIHCAEGLHAPIIGDRRHGPFKPASLEDRLYLHAKRITFPDPFRAGRSIDVACDIETATKPKPRSSSVSSSSTPRAPQRATKNTTPSEAKLKTRERGTLPIPGESMGIATRGSRTRRRSQHSESESKWLS